MSAEYFNDQWRIPNNKNQSLVSNYSMEFNGINDFVDISVASNDVVPSRVSDWTYSAWLYLDSTVTGSVPCIFERGLTYPGAGMIVGVKNTDKSIYVYTGGTTTTNFTSVTLPTDEWAYFALVYDVSTNGLTCYINNSSQTLTAPSSWSIGSTLFIIGKRQSNHSSYFWKGKMDQVSVFDYALPATGTNSVATLYGGGTAVTNPMSLSPKPISYYQLGDQSAYNGANYLVPNNSLQDYVFDFLSDRITIPTITIASSATISIWVNIRAFSSVTQQTLFGDENLTKIVLNDQGGFVRVIYSDNNGFGTLTTNLVTSDFINKWHHIALVQNSGAGTVYIDNINKGNISGTLRTPDFKQIGAIFPGGAYLNGFISNAALFSTNLPATGTESIASLYNNGSPALDISSYSNLERWYKLNAADTFDGTNWTITDYASSNDGTSVGMTSSNLVQSNLQQTSGYSPYALDFDGTDQAINLNSAIALTGNRSVNFWFTWRTSGIYLGGATGGIYYPFILTSTSVYLKTSNVNNSIITIPALQVGVFYNMCITGDGTTVSVYINGSLAGTGTDIANITLDTIANTKSPTTNGVNGNMSNVAIWDNTVLSQSEITEIYNQGVPSNLNTFSGTKPTAWWQLGSNSSFNTNWTCLDEMGTNNGISVNMTNDDIVNGVGYSANGLGTSSIDIKGDAPYSSANGLSENMDVLDRTTDVPS